MEEVPAFGNPTTITGFGKVKARVVRLVVGDLLLKSGFGASRYVLVLWRRRSRRGRCCRRSGCRR